jgi:hypothetical protein
MITYRKSGGSAGTERRKGIEECKKRMQNEE